MNQLGLDAIVAIAATALWLITFLPLRRFVRVIAGLDGQGRYPVAAELLMLLHLCVLVVALVAGLDFGIALIFPQ